MDTRDPAPAAANDTSTDPQRTPVVNRCRRAGIPRTVAAILAVVLIVALVLALLLVILPLVQEELSMLLQRVLLLADFFAARIAPWLDSTLGVKVALDLNTVRGVIAENAKQAGEIGLQVLGSVKSGGLVLISILTGVLVFIPYIGFGIGFLLGMGAALLQWSGWPAFLAVLSVYGVGQLLDNHVLIPSHFGHRIGLHPLTVIFALLAFGQLFGFAGVLLALPASAALLVVLRQLRSAYFASPIYRAR